MKPLSRENIDIARRVLYKRNFREFVCGIKEGYQPSWHHEIIMAEIQRLIDDSSVNKLILTMPPRHGKSELASRCLPAWLFARDPDISIITASYSAELSEAMCRDVQNIMSSEDYAKLFPASSIDGSKKSIKRSDYFEMPKPAKGKYRSAGVGGSLTGMGGNVLILDDPVKNSEEANSVSISEKTWEWFGSTFLTRAAPNSKVLVIQTRWSEKDIAGRILSSEDKDNWRVISFPAIQFNNPYRHEKDTRENGEVLWPAMFPITEINKIRPLMSKRDFNCLYQCTPIDNEGNIIRPSDFRYYDNLDGIIFSKVIQSWDLAFSDTNDYVAGIVIGVKDNNYYVLDLYHKKVNFTQTIQAIQLMKQLYPSTQKIYIEKSANGFAAIDTLSKILPGMIYPVKALGSKVSRVEAILYLIENNRVLLPNNAPWLTEFLYELGGFPNTEHDDMVDALSQGLSQLNPKNALTDFLKLYGK